MTRSSRDKLNSIYFGVSIAVAAVLGAASGSGFVFLLVAGGLITMFAGSGQIRLGDGRTRNRRR